MDNLINDKTDFKLPDKKGEITNIKCNDIPKKEVKRPVFSGPFKIKTEVLKEGRYRLDGKPYDLESGDIFDGSKITPKKLALLIEQKYVRIIQ